MVNVFIVVTELNMDKLYDELLVELECPICMTYMAPPIRQCATGHSICEPCRKKLPACPLCQGKFTDSKNISLEALARKMHYPCVNSKAGCMERLGWDERENHERECTYKGYKCAYNKCPWSGRYEDLLEHWAQKKITNRPYRNTNVCHTKIQKTESFYVNMIQAYDELFWYKFKSSGGKLFWSVQYIGASEKANDYYFEIELFKPGQPVRRTLLSEYCQSVEIDNKDLFKPGTCVMTSMEAVNHFFGEDQLLIYYMRVIEVGDAAEGSRRDRSVSREPAGHDFGRRNEENLGATARKHNFKQYNTNQKKNFKKKQT